MAPRLLLATTEAPSTGGSGTAGYDLFQRLLADGGDVHLANLVRAAEDNPTWLAREATGNPASLPHVWHCRTPGVLSEPQAEVTALIARLRPDVGVGLGFMAATRLKRAAPALRTVLLTGTCRQAQDLVTGGFAPDAVSLTRALDSSALAPRIVNAAERTAFTLADLVVTHSPLTLDMATRFFPACRGKVYPRPVSYAEWIVDGAARWQMHGRPFAERDVDVLFIASSWARPEKNYALVRAIARQLDGAAIHIVGEVPRRTAGATHHGFVDARDTLFRLIGRARVVAAPSSIDAAPGVLYEAAALGCNVVASKNCGNWTLCHPELLAEPYTAGAFAECIRRGIVRRYPDGLEAILRQQSYRELVALLTAFAQPIVAEALA